MVKPSLFNGWAGGHHGFAQGAKPPTTEESGEIFLGNKRRTYIVRTVLFPRKRRKFYFILITKGSRGSLLDDFHFGHVKRPPIDGRHDRGEWWDF